MALKPDAENYARDKITIQGGTKTVQYIALNENKFIKIYVGGNSLQVSVNIKNSNGRPVAGYNAASLFQDWTEDGYLTLDGRNFDDGAQAENYLISIAPKSNFRWVNDADGTYDYGSKDFKLEVAPIMHDTVPMYVMNDAGGWDMGSGHKVTRTFDDTFKFIRIGNPDNSNEYFDSEEMYSLNPTEAKLRMTKTVLISIVGKSVPTP